MPYSDTKEISQDKQIAVNRNAAIVNADDISALDVTLTDLALHAIRDDVLDQTCSLGEEGIVRPLFIHSGASNASSAGIEFTDQGNQGAQRIYLDAKHSDGQNTGSGGIGFHISSTEAHTNLELNGGVNSNMYVNGDVVWNAGNLDPIKADVTSTQTMSGPLDIRWNSSSPIYSTGQLELYTGNGSDVSMGFHRGGYTACQLRHESNGLILSGTSRTSAANLQVLGGVSATSFTNDQAISGSAASTQVIAPGGGVFAKTASSQTGAIKISLPDGWGNDMMRFTVKIYEYTSRECFEVVCAGYTHGASTSWNNASAYIVGDCAADRNLTVRFGKDPTNPCVWIGETTDTWGYPQVFVTDVQAGYTTGAGAFSDGWVVDFDTGLGTVQHTFTNTQVGRVLDGNNIRTDVCSYEDVLALGNYGTTETVALTTGLYSVWVTTTSSDTNYRTHLMHVESGMTTGYAYGLSLNFGDSTLTVYYNYATNLLTASNYVNDVAGAEYIRRIRRIT